MIASATTLAVQLTSALRPRLANVLPPANLWPSLTIRRSRDLFRGIVKGQHFAHNPNGYDALALLSNRASELLDVAAGQPIATAIAQLGLDGQGTAAVYQRDLPLLWRNGFATTPQVPPPRPHSKPERVFNAWLHLTNACNLACPYCYIHKSKRHMSQHVVERVLASIEATAQSGSVQRIHVRYAGGEPMLRFAVMQRFHAQAVEVCDRHGVHYSAAVLTNGTLVPAGAVQWLRANKVSLSLSIDGVGELQDAMRPVVGGGSSFARVQQGLDTYQDAGIVPYVLVTVGDSNVDGLPQLTNFLLQRRLWFRFSLVRDLEWGSGILDDRRGAADDFVTSSENGHLLQGLALQRVQKVLSQCYDQIEAHVAVENATALARGVAPNIGFRRSHRFCDLQLWQPIQQACGAGRSYLAIGEQGQVSPCQAALHREGTAEITGDSLTQMATTQTQLPQFQRLVGNAACQRCPHRSSCAGGCPLLLHRRSGHVEGQSPYCDVFKAVIPRILHIAALELWGQAEFARAQARTTAVDVHLAD
ncbi:MAG: radical SAM protein [Myxococcales bacterium]|nr:radical SAM protein [Myxococcales bacterium]